MAAFLLVTDLDNTLVGDAEALALLNQQLQQHRRAYGSKIVYSTGRSPTLYRQLTQAQTLLTPDHLILAVGTEIYGADLDHPDERWATRLAQGWDREEIVAIAAHFADLTPQPDSEQRPFKVSYFVTPTAAIAVLPQLEAQIEAQGIAAQLVYSGGMDLDILPRHANKGAALAFLREQLGFAPEATVACGDSGNDLAMFRDRPERGIIVGNAMPELLDWHHAHPSPNRYLARTDYANGILEGLRHFYLL